MDSLTYLLTSFQFSFLVSRNLLPPGRRGRGWDPRHGLLPPVRPPDVDVRGPVVDAMLAVERGTRPPVGLLLRGARGPNPGGGIDVRVRTTRPFF